MTQHSPNPLPVDTRLGHVHLTVSDLPRSLDFYQQSIGLQVHDQEGNQAALGAGGEDLLLLTKISGAVKLPRTSGLYHFAIGKFSTSLEKIPNNATVHYHLGMAYYKEGEKKQARQELENALNLDDKFDGAAEAKAILSKLKYLY